MAKVTVENTREHDITINAHNKSGELVQITIPAARQHADDKNKLVNGSAEIDDEFVAAAKKHAVVKHYFDEGWLVPGKSAKKQEPASGNQPAGNTVGNDANKDNK